MIEKADDILKCLIFPNAITEAETTTTADDRYEEDASMDDSSDLSVTVQLVKILQQRKTLVLLVATTLAPGSLQAIRKEFSYFESKGKYLTLIFVQLRLDQREHFRQLATYCQLNPMRIGGRIAQYFMSS